AGPPRNPPSSSLTLKTWASVDSKNAVAAPKNAITHIQKTAPGPPRTIAVATPAIFPVPTRDAALMVTALKGEIPFEPSGRISACSLSTRNISLNHLNWTNLELIEKYRPARINNPTRKSPQSRSLPTEIADFNHSGIIFSKPI